MPGVTRYGSMLASGGQGEGDRVMGRWCPLRMVAGKEPQEAQAMREPSCCSRWALQPAVVDRGGAGLSALVDGGGAAGARMLGIGALVGEVAGVDFFADDATDDRGRCSAGLLDVFDGDRAGGDGGADLVGADPTPRPQRLPGAWCTSRVAVGDATEAGAAEHGGGDAFGFERVANGIGWSNPPPDNASLTPGSTACSATDSPRPYCATRPLLRPTTESNAL